MVVSSATKLHHIEGAAKVSFHMNGQQNVDFVDETHATGTCYALATLVTEEDGKDKAAIEREQSDASINSAEREQARPKAKLTVHAVRYFDKYVKIDGRWWIAEREQHFEWSTNQALG